MHEYIIPIVAIFCTIGLPIIAVTVIILAKIIRGSGRGGSSGGAFDAEETQLIQEIHRSLVKLENRVDSLETIILDRERNTRPNR